MKGEQRRRFSRIPFAMAAEVTVGDESYSVTEINDIAVGGGSFPIRAALTPGAACRVRIFLGAPGDEPVVNVEGRVLRSEPGGIAVQFVRIDPDSLYHLQNIIRYNAPDPAVVEQEIDKHPGLI